MANWNVMSETTSGKKEDPVTCGFAFHHSGAKQPLLESYPDQWLVYVALREGGGDDKRMPRRAVGMGTDRASARRSLAHMVSRYDSLGTIVYPSERASDAVE